MRLLDLFAGIGGFSLAAHWMGWETAAFVEKEPFCQKVLSKNFPGVPIYDDVRTFPGESFRGRIDLITGGFPCQPFSAAGKREGRADERHLFPAMLGIIRDVRPLWVVAENVRGLLSIESGEVFAEVIASLEGEGYEVITFCVPASAVEAWHQRQRPFFIAYHTEHARRERCSGQYATVSDGVRKENGLPESPGRDASYNAERSRLERFYNGQEPVGRSGSIRSGFAADRSRTWIEAAAGLCGMDNGVPKRMDRIKALGNAVVPQVALEIFRAIESTENEQ